MIFIIIAHIILAFAWGWVIGYGMAKEIHEDKKINK